MAGKALRGTPTANMALVAGVLVVAADLGTRAGAPRNMMRRIERRGYKKDDKARVLEEGGATT